MADTQNLDLAMIILALIYGVLTCFAIFRLCKLKNFTSEWRHTKCFYLIIILQVALRAFGFVLIAVEFKSSQTTYGYFFFSIPDSLFIVSFLLMFWQMITVYYYSHYEHSLCSSLIAALSKRAHQSKPSQMFVFLMIIWIGTQSCLYLALGLGRITMRSITNEVGVMNVLLPTIAIATIVYLQRRYSGSPVKSREWKQRLHRMTGTTLLWSLCRYFRGVTEILEVYSDSKVDGNFTDMVTTIILVTCLIVSEVICVFLVLDFGFIRIFMLTEEEAQVSKEEVNSLTMVTRDGESTLEDPLEDRYIRRFTVLSEAPTILRKDVEIADRLEMRPNALGLLSKGIFKGHPVAFREIIFMKKSNYIVDEFMSEIEILRNLSLPNLLPLYGAIIDPEDKDKRCVFSLLYPWMNKGSLYDLLHNATKAGFNDSEKRRIAKEIAIGMHGLHSISRYHGHLTSRNILLDEHNRVFIADLGLNRLKKYAGITLKYCNKSAWSSPELLRERNPTPLKPTTSDDIYSYGVLLWEILTGQIPFSGASRESLTKEMEEGNRLSIPETVPEDLSVLIRSCWNVDPTSRPSFDTILRKVFDSASPRIN